MKSVVLNLALPVIISIWVGKFIGISCPALLPQSTESSLRTGVARAPGGRGEGAAQQDAPVLAGQQDQGAPRACEGWKSMTRAVKVA